MKINEALHYFKQGYLNESFCRPPISALIFTREGDVSDSFYTLKKKWMWILVKSSMYYPYNMVARRN